MPSVEAVLFFEPWLPLGVLVGLVRDGYLQLEPSLKDGWHLHEHWLVGHVYLLAHSDVDENLHRARRVD